MQQMQRTPPTLSPRVFGAEELVLPAAMKLRCLCMQSTGASKLPTRLSPRTISQTGTAKPFDGNSRSAAAPQKAHPGLCGTGAVQIKIKIMEPVPGGKGFFIWTSLHG